MKAYLIATLKEPHRILRTYSQKSEALLHLAINPTHFYQEVDADLLAGSYEEYDNHSEDLFQPYWIERQDSED